MGDGDAKESMVAVRIYLGGVESGKWRAGGCVKSQKVHTFRIGINMF